MDKLLSFDLEAHLLARCRAVGTAQVSGTAHEQANTASRLRSSVGFFRL